MQLEKVKSGIFISYRRSYSFFAGRIHDYLKFKGLCPYMDVYKMKQDYYLDVLKERISESPYFLLVLAKDCFNNLNKKDIFIQEILTALEIKDAKDIIVVSDDKFSFNELDSSLGLDSLKNHQCDKITHDYFETDMKKIISNIDINRLNNIVDWKEYIELNNNILVSSRLNIEKNYSTIINRFGEDLVSCVVNHNSFHGVNKIRQIRMSCYAASIIFNPARNMVDDKAFDNGFLFNVFGELLKDEDFSLEILINAPDSIGAKEAIRNNMLGNSALEEIPEAVFYSSYINLNRLINEEPIFKKAYENRRFRFYLTDIVMSGAIFQIEYKKEWERFDHIKYDIYSYDLESNMDRRTMIFFKNNNYENYQFFCKSYNYLKSHRYKKELINQKHPEWMKKWEEIEEDL